MMRYISWRIVDGKPRRVIIDDNGKIVNIDPSKEELKYIKNEIRSPQDTRKVVYYTDEQLLNFLIQSYEKYGRIPTTVDFENNQEYPNRKTYDRRFGSFQKSLKLIGLDVDSMTKKGILETKHQKGRFGEILIKDHFKRHPVDLAGENHHSPCDGICPNGKTYDVKSSGLDYSGRYYRFGTANKYKEYIDIYYLLGFNRDYTKLENGWRIPGELAEKDSIHIGFYPSYELNIENMKQYDITDKLGEVLKKYEFFNKVRPIK